MPDLFDDPTDTGSRRMPLAAGAVLLRGRALTAEEQVLAAEEQVLAALGRVVDAAPFRHMVTPGGYRMSVAVTNCGAAGWVTDRAGYRYDAIDPESGVRWPPMPSDLRGSGRRGGSGGGF